jgi:alginate O-acetyltransferase complex protein AlgI
MLFNSLSFAIFLPIVFALYWFLPKNSTKKQNLIILASSYLFYGLWDVRFMFLLAFSTLLDYFTGLKIHEANTKKKKKIWLLISVGVNLGFLFFFKYYNFFIDSFSSLISSIGFTPDAFTIKVILPVGISFYTFHGLSYVFDIYYKDYKPTKNIVDYSVFVSFFPLLVAGPIERANHLLPQVQNARVFDTSKAIDGLRQILWGLFKKIVIADSCAEYANMIFNNSADYNGSTLVIGALLFTFQIYGDFSGYSDIALGVARLFGFELLRNFAFPYFSRDIAEFWRRWHISLSGWFRDYVYFPLGGSKNGLKISIRNTFIIFILSGFWHGANWTFLIWGTLNALYFMPLLILKRNRNNLEIVAQGKYLPTVKEVSQIAITFSLTVFAWIFFRANNIEHSFDYISTIFSSSLFSSPQIFPSSVFVLIGLFMLIEWLGRENTFAIANIAKHLNRPVRWLFYYLIIFLIFMYSGQEQQFIYFQF